MAKGPWEDRVGMWLRHYYFSYAYKPVDSPGHGGVVRIDWLACDAIGHFWMVEVKQIDPTAKVVNIFSEVSPLQRASLRDVAKADYSFPVLAVGQGNMLWLWGWRDIEWLLKHREEQGVEHYWTLSLETASAGFHWTGETRWVPGKQACPWQFNPLSVLANSDDLPQDSTGLNQREDRIAQMPTIYSPLLPARGVSLSTLKHEGLVLSKGVISRDSSPRFTRPAAKVAGSGRPVKPEKGTVRSKRKASSG